MTDPTRTHLSAPEQVHRPDKYALARKLRRAMTPAEYVLWSYLRGQRLVGRWRRQHVIRGFVVDFYCPGLGVVVEVDGDVHDAQVAEDLRRDQALVDLGLIVVHLRNDEVLEHLPATLHHLRAILEPIAPR